MIWTKSGIVEDHQLSISVLDRTFEHGLGLFETMRTWNGRVPLLNRHLQRLNNSAEALDLPLDPASLPDQTDIQALIDASGITGDARLRLVASGGVPGEQPSAVWLRCWPQEPFEWTKLKVAYTDQDDNDPLERHKTLNYWSRIRTWKHYQTYGHEPILYWVNGTESPPSLISGELYARESARANLFTVQLDGRRRPVLRTPDLLTKPILPGLMRELVLERARAAGLSVREAPLSLPDLESADEVFLTNAVRGIMPVAELPSRFNEFLAAPGPVTRNLWENHVLPWLHHGGDQS